MRDFDLHYDKLVYLAATNSIRHVCNTVVPLLEAAMSAGADPDGLQGLPAERRFPRQAWRIHGPARKRDGEVSCRYWDPVSLGSKALAAHIKGVRRILRMYVCDFVRTLRCYGGGANSDPKPPERNGKFSGWSGLT